MSFDLHKIVCSHSEEAVAMKWLSRVNSLAYRFSQ